MNTLLQLLVIIIIFLIFTLFGVYIFKKLNNSSNRYLNPEEFLPIGEIQTLKQVIYLILMAACFINVLYALVTPNSDIFNLAIFDIVLSLIIAVNLDKNSIKNKILWLLIIPYGSLAYILFGFSFAMYIDIIHVVVFLYFIKIYFDKFMKYTESNGLGLAIMLLFLIIFISFLFTQAVEKVNPLDSLVMVSNAFTSNGYAVLGKSIPGKINSVFLVWGGYIISGAGTATLTASLLIRHFNKRVRQLERLIEEGDVNE